MPHKSYRIFVAFTVLGMFAAVSPMAASAAPTQVTVRVEGANATILPETQVETDSRTLPTEPSSNPVCTGSGEPVFVSGPTAIGVLADASTIGGFSYGISDQYSFGLLVCRIGAESSMADLSSYWLYKVNHVFHWDSPDQYALVPGDRILWYLANGEINSTLDVSVPTRVAAGADLEVAVLAYDDTGLAEPAAGATVYAGSAAATSDSEGKAAFRFSDPGYYAVRAERPPSSVRSPVVTVCVYQTITGECEADNTASTSRFVKPVDGLVYRKLTRLHGDVGADPSGVETVRLRIKRIRNRRCSWWSASSNRFIGSGSKGSAASASSRRKRRSLRASSCSSAQYFDIGVNAQGRWKFRFPKRLPSGIYAANVRAVDGSGNIETRIKDGENRVRFLVRRRVRSRVR